MDEEMPPQTWSQRTISDVDRILGFAKMDTSELKPTVQCLHFVPGLDNESVKLLEMDSNVMAHIELGESVVVRGNKTDPAVLCTADKTFELRVAETSNLLLVVPELDMKPEPSDGELYIAPKQVCALKQDYFELRTIKPRLKHMASLLEENTYSGQECEDDEHHQGHKYSLKALLERVQASRAEMLKGLNEMQACCIDGFWRLLDFDFETKLVTDILALRDERDWSFEAIPSAVCCSELKEIYPRAVIMHVLRCMSQVEHIDFESPTTDEIYSLGEDKVCCFFAKLLLNDVDKFNLKDFEQTWQQAVPDGLNTSLSQLQGTVLVERDTKPQVIRYFPVSKLPEEPAERFNKLFRTKPKWTLDEITPFLNDLCTEKLGVSGLLLKFARASNLNGIKVYSSKKPL